jgi:hypothetical protein
VEKKKTSVWDKRGDSAMKMPNGGVIRAPLHALALAIRHCSQQKVMAGEKKGSSEVPKLRVLAVSIFQTLFQTSIDYFWLFPSFRIKVYELRTRTTVQLA